MVNNINPGKYRRGKIGQVQSAVHCPTAEEVRDVIQTEWFL